MRVIKLQVGDQAISHEIKENILVATVFSKIQLPGATTGGGGTGPTTTTTHTVPLRLYDPGFKNTSVCKSKISTKANSVLYYRGLTQHSPP